VRGRQTPFVGPGAGSKVAALGDPNIMNIGGRSGAWSFRVAPPESCTMARRFLISLVAPAALLCCFMLASGSASAQDPDDFFDPEEEEEEEEDADAIEDALVIRFASPAPMASGVEGPAVYMDKTIAAEPTPDELEPEPRTVLKLRSGYVGFGVAPGMTPHGKGFHPNTRLELEFGGTLEHRVRDLGLSFGVVSQLTPYYERKRPSFGWDVTATAMLGPVYVRTGLGAVWGLPRGHVLDESSAGIGGVVGLGLNMGRAPVVRVGVDYDLRVTTRLEPVHTFFLALRIACCRATGD
jgi:hypothetical protein